MAAMNANIHRRAIRQHGNPSYGDKYDETEQIALLLAPTLALPTMLPGTASAASGGNVGSLNCTVAGGIGLILGSSKAVTCNFTPTGGGTKQTYSGNIGKLGVDIGV